MSTILIDSSYFLEAMQEGTPFQAQLEDWLRSRETVQMEVLSFYQVLLESPNDSIRSLLPEIFQAPEPILPEDALMAGHLHRMYFGPSKSIPRTLTAAVALRLHAPLATATPGAYRPLEKEGLILLPVPGHPSEKAEP